MGYDSKSRTTLAFVIMAAAMIGLAIPAARGADDGLTWHTQLAKAQEESKRTGKPILADFTGSDWCEWCQAMTKDVFSSAEFRNWSKENVVLLKLDFPEKKKLPEEIRKQNEQLKKQFKVSTFPTVILFKHDMTELGRIAGYPQEAKDGAEARAIWMEKVRKILKK